MGLARGQSAGKSRGRKSRRSILQFHCDTKLEHLRGSAASQPCPAARDVSDYGRIARRGKPAAVAAAGAGVWGKFAVLAGGSGGIVRIGQGGAAMNLSIRDKRAIKIGGGGLAAVAVLAFIVIPICRAGTRTARPYSRLRGRRSKSKSAQMDQLLHQQARLKKQYGSAATHPVVSDAQKAHRNLYEATQDVLKASGLQVTAYEPQRPRRP